MTKDSTVYIEKERLQAIASQLLEAGGFTAREAQMTARSLVLSNLLGHDSHGVVRVAEYIHDLKKGIITSNATLETLRESENNLLADAHAGLGQVRMPELLEKLLEKAEKQAVVSGAMHNCGHTGRLGEWVEIIADAGYAGFMAVNDNGALRIVAPPGGRSPCTSTNPLAFGIPLPEASPFSFDMSTSAVAVGKIRLAHISGEMCAPGLLIDAQGQETTDPAVMFADPPGSLLPLGGAQAYKGFGLSMIVDFLTAGLAGGFTPPEPDAPVLNNVLVTIWNPSYFAGFEHMSRQAQKYIDFLRTIPPANPNNPVRIAGDRAHKEKTEREKSGIPLNSGMCQRLARSAEITGIPVPEEILEFI